MKAPTDSTLLYTNTTELSSFEQRFEFLFTNLEAPNWLKKETNNSLINIDSNELIKKHRLQKLKQEGLKNLISLALDTNINKKEIEKCLQEINKSKVKSSYKNRVINILIQNPELVKNPQNIKLLLKTYKVYTSDNDNRDLLIKKLTKENFLVKNIDLVESVLTNVSKVNFKNSFNKNKNKLIIALLMFNNEDDFKIAAMLINNELNSGLNKNSNSKRFNKLINFVSLNSNDIFKHLKSNVEIVKKLELNDFKNTKKRQAFEHDSKQLISRLKKSYPARIEIFNRINEANKFKIRLSLEIKISFYFEIKEYIYEDYRTKAVKNIKAKQGQVFTEEIRWSTAPLSSIGDSNYPCWRVDILDSEKRVKAKLYHNEDTGKIYWSKPMIFEKRASPVSFHF